MSFNLSVANSETTPLVAEATVEALDEDVLHRLAGRDVVPFHARLLVLAQHRHRGQP